MNQLSSSLLEKLPSHVMKQVLDQVSMIDIIDTSFSCGDRLVAAIQDAKYPLTSITLNFDTEKPSIQFRNKEKECSWNLYQQEGQMSTEKRRIGRYNIPSTKTSNAIYGEHHDVELSMHMVLNHLLRIFHCTNTIIEKVVVDLAAIEDPGVVLGKLSNFRQVKNLKVGNWSNDGLTAFQANSRFWSQLPRILKMLQGIEHVDIQVPDSPSKPIRELMAIDSVVLDGVNWLTKEVIGEFYWKTAKLKNTKLQELDIVEILKKYLESQSDRLELLEIKVEIDVKEKSKTVLNKLPNDSYEVYKRNPTSKTELSPVARILFNPWTHYIRITRRDGNAINVYFSPKLVAIKKSTPETNEALSEPAEAEFRRRWIAMIHQEFYRDNNNGVIVFEEPDRDPSPEPNH